MSVERRQIERWIGAVLAPEVRVAGTIRSPTEIVPSREYLRRFPPALVVAFGRTPSGAVSPTPQLERVRGLCRELGEVEPLVACDLEQGAGLHFAEGTRLPPALALASAATSEPLDAAIDWIEAAGACTGREARAFGVGLVLAPVADVNTRGDNPIIAARSFGDRPPEVAARALAFARGLASAGVAACAKHFPGHGDTRQDSHVELARVERDASGLREIELAPFAALIEAEIETVMVGHLEAPALTGRHGWPCTLAWEAIEGVLRREQSFRGVVLTDAMNMGALEHHPKRYVRALAAGCDVLLCPHDLDAAARELLKGVEDGAVAPARLAEAARRVTTLRDHVAARRSDPVDVTARAAHAQLAASLADRALRYSGDARALEPGAAWDVLEPLAAVETPEVRTSLERLRAAVRGTGATRGSVLPVICESRVGRGSYGLTGDELGALEARLASERASELLVVWFGSPQTLPRRLWQARRPPILLAFAPTPPLFEAVGRWLGPGAGPRVGSLPTALG